MMHWHDAFKNKLSSGDLMGAESLCREAISRDPDDWNAHYLLGVTLRHQEDFHGAILAYEKALRNCPRPALVLAARGIAYQQLGRYQEAIAEFVKSLELEPHSAECLNSLALTQKMMGQPYKALYNYCVALTAAGIDASGLARERGGAETRSDADGNRSLHLNPGYLDLFFRALGDTSYFTIAQNIAKVLAEVGDHSRSRMVLSAVAKGYPVDEALVTALMREAKEIATGT
jgi:tetratricopeptide (TPR) repeat protein